MNREQQGDNAKASPAINAELAFPCLADDMINRVFAYGVEISYPRGSTLFKPGEREVDMFIVLQGSIDIDLIDENGERTTIVRLVRRQFSGELDLFNSHRTLVHAHTSQDSTLIRVPRPQLRRLMRAEGDIANLIMQATIWRRQKLLMEENAAMVVLAKTGTAETIRLQQFLTRNCYPHRIQDPTAEEIAYLRSLAPGKVRRQLLPAIKLRDGRILYRPSTEELADELGIAQPPDSQSVYDVTIIGAGPSGLAAAVCAASEGLSTLIVEGNSPGGQAGASSRIENYLGFPTGISGQELAKCAHMQAQKFGARLALAREAIGLKQSNGVLEITLNGGQSLYSRTAVIATGAKYRKLDLPNFAQYENQGIYYAATAMEASFCRNSEVVVVGGGNSAGQAATFLSGIASHVHLIIRGASLSSTMSDYLINRIETSGQITIHRHSEIRELMGSTMLESVSWVNRLTGLVQHLPISSLFAMIGAEPNTGWLYGTLLLDKNGFISTGTSEAFELSPYATNVPGVYAIGDVRSNSVKRIASAVGEGSVVVSAVHRYLAAIRNEPGDHRYSVASIPPGDLITL